MIFDGGLETDRDRKAGDHNIVYYFLSLITEERNSPPRANQGLSKGEARHSHALFTHLVHSLTSPCPTFLLIYTSQEVTSRR